MRERWVVISNCQSLGLANSIDSLARDIDCVACDNWEFGRRIAEDPDHFRSYDFAILLPDVRDWIGEAKVDLPPHIEVPAFQFCPYHPDSVYVFADGDALAGGMGSYHSLIALAAYKEGRSAEQAAAFFTSETYAAAGYFNLWTPYRNGLVELFADYDFDIAPIFVRGARGQSLMHTVNHPRIEVLFEIARMVLTRLGRAIYADVDPPPDNLAGLSWPVYPEIGEPLGIRGSYLFRPPQRNKPLELIPFLDQSLRVFAAWDRSQLSVIPHLRPSLKRIRRAMQAAS